jgi:hypothetical protein
MARDPEPHLQSLTATAIGAEAAAATLAVLEIPASARANDGPSVSRTTFAMALNAALFHGLVERAPTGAAYVADVRAAGGRVMLDHGALRTVRLAEGPTGALPPGYLAFARILEPLGYEAAGLYPLERLKMTGRAFRHRDDPEGLPQFFVSELHADRFSPAFQAVAAHLFGATRDPLDATARAALDALARENACEAQLAHAAMPVLVAAFGRWSPRPELVAYEALLAESAEAAWIATEGNAFNHATDRVGDVEAVAEAQRRLGRPIKPQVERSASGRVRQTAFRADPVAREFLDGERVVTRQVPGSFYEFITRDRLPSPVDGVALDLGFDSGNAQGIFKMTAPA